LKALYREYERDYVEGRIPLEELKDRLDKLATLWGKVKTDLGVDWILWSEKEREYMIMIAKEKRERYLARKKG